MTFRCPSCSRALNLPERFAPARAACPLCKHEFDVPSPDAPQRPAVSPWVGEDEEDRPARPSQLPLLTGEDYRAAESAASWLRHAATAAALHLFCCSCFSFGFVAWLHQRPALYALGTAYAFQLGVAVTASLASRSMRRRGSLGLVNTAGVLCLVLAVVVAIQTTAVHAEPVLQALRRNNLLEGDSPPILISLAGGVALVVFLLVAGDRTLRALSRPGVRDAFPR